jgi:hemerythrin
VVDLALDTWTSVDGLEVMPVAAPHPVDTTMLFFRALGPSGYRTYAHLADIPALSVLDGMVTADPRRNGVTRAFHDAFRGTLRTAVDVKKVDVGGGAIHGDAEDFAGDPSGRLVLSHTDAPLTSRQRAIGAQAVFGEADVLIRFENDAHTVERALFYLRAYLPEVAEHELAVFANSPTLHFRAGTEIIRAGTVSEDLYFILGGLVASRSAEGALVRRLSAGALIGEITAISGEPALLTHTAASDVTTLRIPLATCRELIRRNGLAAAMLSLRERRQFLEGTWLFGEMISFHVLHRLARVLERRTAESGADPVIDGHLALLVEGRVTLFSASGTVEELAPGDFWGEGDLLCRATPVRARAATPLSFFLLPAKEIAGIPIVSWKLIETCDRRRKQGNAGMPRSRGGPADR